jgi:hypothetical protein
MQKYLSKRPITRRKESFVGTISTNIIFKVFVYFFKGGTSEDLSVLLMAVQCRRIRLIESNAKCRYLKK